MGDRVGWTFVRDDARCVLGLYGYPIMTHPTVSVYITMIMMARRNFWVLLERCSRRHSMETVV